MKKISNENLELSGLSVTLNETVLGIVHGIPLRYFATVVLSSVRPYCPVNASGQAVTGDHAAELVNTGKIARIDEASEGEGVRQGERKERADGANIGQLIT